MNEVVDEIIRRNEQWAEDVRKALAHESPYDMEIRQAEQYGRYWKFTDRLVASLGDGVQERLRYGLGTLEYYLELVKHSGVILIEEIPGHYGYRHLRTESLAEALKEEANVIAVAYVRSRKVDVPVQKKGTKSD